MKETKKEKVDELLMENFFYTFGYPREIVTDQGVQFTSHLIENILRQYHIKHITSIAYLPQENG